MAPASKIGHPLAGILYHENMLVVSKLALPSAAIDILAGKDVTERKPIIADYLRYLRRVKGNNDNECRMMAKQYLQCRMGQSVDPMPLRNSAGRICSDTITLPAHDHSSKVFLVGKRLVSIDMIRTP